MRFCNKYLRAEQWTVKEASFSDDGNEFGCHKECYVNEKVYFSNIPLVTSKIFFSDIPHAAEKNCKYYKQLIVSEINL